MSMKRPLSSLFFVLFSFLFFQSCTVNNVTIDDKIGGYFEDNGVQGTFGMFDNSRGEFTIYDLDRFKTNATPGETFHIVHALVALHTGRLSDDSSLVVGNDSAAQSMSVYSAFRANSATHFRSIAQMIGKDTLQYWIDSLKYGNKKMGTDLLHFWNNDSLTISADEQLGLIKRLYFKQHPFRASVQETVKKMMVVENNAQYQLAYQTGMVQYPDKMRVWVVGWMEENRHVYPFVLHFDAKPETDHQMVGQKLTKEILTHIGFFKGIM
jgi:beta-lactamase class D